MPATEIPATFKIDLDGNINYVNPETGTNTLWTNSNATKHMVTGNLVLILRLV